MNHNYPLDAKFVSFFGNDSPFSQFYPAPIVGCSVIVGDQKDNTQKDSKLAFPTAEHWMHYYKAVLFEDVAVAAAILKAKTPKEAKRLGRTVSKFKEDVWSKYRVQIVLEANIHKFMQHSDLCAILMATGDKFLVEASPYDKIWGIGLRKCPHDPTQWKGLNLLGRVLDKTKEYIKHHPHLNSESTHV